MTVSEMQRRSGRGKFLLQQKTGFRSRRPDAPGQNLTIFDTLFCVVFSLAEKPRRISPWENVQVCVCVCGPDRWPSQKQTLLFNVFLLHVSLAERTPPSENYLVHFTTYSRTHMLSHTRSLAGESVWSAKTDTMV